MSRFLQFILGVAMLSIVTSSSSAELIAQLNVNINKIGAHSGNIFYINLEQVFTKPCKYGMAYCKVDNAESCKSMLSIALTAKSTGKSVADFRYEYDDVTQMCYVWLISME